MLYNSLIFVKRVNENAVCIRFEIAYFDVTGYIWWLTIHGIYSILDNSFRWIWSLNTNILLHIWLKLEILQCDLFLHLYFVSNLKLFHDMIIIYIASLEYLEILFFVLEEFLSRYVYIYIYKAQAYTRFN